MPEDSIPVLKAILETAAKQSPTVIMKAIQLEQAEAATYFSRSAMLPAVSGSFSFATTTVYPEIGDANKSSGPYYNFGVTQPIYQWNALKNQHEISKIGVKISQKNYVDGYRGLLNTLRSQFLGLIYRKINLQTQRFNLALTKKYLALDEVRAKAGELSPVQMIIPRMNGVDAELAMARSDEDYDHMKRSFIRLAGIDSLPEEAIPLEVPTWAGSNELVASLAALLKRDGVDVTLQGQLNTLSLKQDDLNYKIAKVRLYPKVSASAGVSQTNNQVVTTTYVSQSASKSWNFNVVANWTIFDGFASRGSKISALAAKRSHEQDRIQLTAALEEDVRSMSRESIFPASIWRSPSSDGQGRWTQ
jgi:outer membrane protein TolC